MTDWSWVAYTVLEVLIAFACFLGNALVVCAVCIGIRDSLREPTFCFLVSLAVADFLVGVAAVPLAVLLDGWVSVTPDLCLLLSCVVLVLTQASVLSLLAISVDRYLRLHIPLSYFPPFMVYFNFLGCVMAPLLVMTLLYTRIFRSLQGRLKESCPQAQASLLREKRLACSLALVLILFAGCWIPLHLMNCLLLFQGPQAVTRGTLYTGRTLSPDEEKVSVLSTVMENQSCAKHRDEAKRPNDALTVTDTNFVPRMGSVCVPGRISIREEGGGDGGQRGGGAVGELELAEEGLAHFVTSVGSGKYFRHLPQMPLLRGICGKYFRHLPQMPLLADASAAAERELPQDARTLITSDLTLLTLQQLST
ncbi:hypothetical protein F7725_000749 [Dissostichus mawsoni]|uniref:G-protein coupled receptors family 1 profile domain-containing protein n=1 Tax=Dissostichus mawsoni TaxID=36200 RepID=A0A7J5ZFB4_DISMA|nr:hypothetical protein F7725_000749 [Dissostichus mawsoni]